MWRRILLAAVFSSVGIGQAVGADVRPWAGFDFAKSLRNHDIAEVSREVFFLIYSETILSEMRLTIHESPLPDTTVIPPLKQHFEYVLPGTCVSAISAGPDFKCTGRDKDHLVCSGMVVTVRGKVDDCLQINVVKD